MHSRRLRPGWAHILRHVQGGKEIRARSPRLVMTALWRVAEGSDEVRSLKKAWRATHLSSQGGSAGVSGTKDLGVCVGCLPGMNAMTCIPGAASLTRPHPTTTTPSPRITAHHSYVIQRRRRPLTFAPSLENPIATERCAIRSREFEAQNVPLRSDHLFSQSIAGEGRLSRVDH